MAKSTDGLAAELNLGAAAVFFIELNSNSDSGAASELNGVEASRAC